MVLPEFNNSLPELVCSDDDSGNEDALEMEYSEAEAEELKRNAEVHAYQLKLLKNVVMVVVDFNYSIFLLQSGELANSFRLISVVSHIGSSSSSGKYVLPYTMHLDLISSVS